MYIEESKGAYVPDESGKFKYTDTRPQAVPL